MWSSCDEHRSVILTHSRQYPEDIHFGAFQVIILVEQYFTPDVSSASSFELLPCPLIQLQGKDPIVCLNPCQDLRWGRKRNCLFVVRVNEHVGVARRVGGICCERIQSDSLLRPFPLPSDLLVITAIPFTVSAVSMVDDGTHSSSYTSHRKCP